MSEEETCCGCVNLTSDDEYDLGLHIGAIFIIFGVSAAGALLPILSKHVQQCAAYAMVVEWLMAFGFGVVLATGLIHMINEGIEMLSDPCLGNIVEEYESLGLAVVLITLVFMQLIECESSRFFADKASALHPHTHTHAQVNVHNHPDAHMSSIATPSVLSTPRDEENPYIQEKKNEHSLKDEGISPNTKRKLSALLFEFGVVLHSVIIGLDLGVTTGTEFKTLLAALCFHQFFEGIAISSTAVDALEEWKNVLLMNFAFCITTPIGLVIGIAIRSTYSSSSTTALWVQGVLNCVAGGILVYTALVELLTYHMTTNHKFLTRPTRERLAMYAALWMGAGLMALIGKWA